MDKIVAGMDVSGNPESGNHKFMAIVIGTDESIRALTKRLGPELVHMNRVRGRDAKNAVIDAVTFDGRNRMGLCIRLEKKRTFSRIQGAMKREREFASSKKLSRAYHALMRNHLREPLEQFLRQHNCEAHRLDFQCDYDCSRFVDDCGWRRSRPGSAHALADILAWSNNRGREPRGAVRLDLSDLLEGRMLKMFK